MMEEPEVIRAIRLFFEGKGWKVSSSSYRFNVPGARFETDIVAEREDNRYLIQAKGDRAGQEYYLIQYALGEIVAVMHQEKPGTRYGLALTETVATHLWKFGLVGLRKLNLHVFTVNEDYGFVSHLAPEAVLKFIKTLREGDGVSFPALSTET